MRERMPGADVVAGADAEAVRPMRHGSWNLMTFFRAPFMSSLRDPHGPYSTTNTQPNMPNTRDRVQFYTHARRGRAAIRDPPVCLRERPLAPFSLYLKLAKWPTRPIPTITRATQYARRRDSTRGST